MTTSKELRQGKEDGAPPFAPLAKTLDYWINYFLLVRQLEQHVKITLDSISIDEQKKRELIRGDAVDKAEQLSEFIQLIFEKLNYHFM